MSDNSGDVQVQKEPLPDGKKFFISHCNSYTGKALLSELNNKGTKDVDGQPIEERCEH